MRAIAAILLGSALAAVAAADPGMSPLGAANAALQAGEADKALALLNSLPRSTAYSADAHQLRCRVYFTLEQWEAAVSECEQAVNQDGNNSDDHLWLGRALGERADKVSFVTAYALAKRARAEFERAVQLNPRSGEALADLGEFYSAAPSVVGGGMDKAAGVAAQLDRVDAARAHELRSAIAQGNNDEGTAEREMKQAISLSAHPAFQWMRLASFYRHRKRWADMESALQSGMAAALRDKTAGVALFNGASVLVSAGRDQALATKLLNAYLAGPRKTEEAPTFVAHVWLARLMNQKGDTGAAQRERAAALALANGYKPAQDLKF